MSDYEQIKQRARQKTHLGRGITYAFLALWAVIVLFPFYWMILTSVKSYGSYNAEYIPKLYTTSPTLQNYADAFTQVPLARYFVNTIVCSRRQRRH